MILALVFAYLAYKKANESGRSGIAWAFIAIAAFIGTQFVLGILLGLLFAGGILALGWSETVFEDYDILFTILGIAGGLGGGFVVLHFLNRVPEEESYAPNPPPPPSFGTDI